MKIREIARFREPLAVTLFFFFSLETANTHREREREREFSVLITKVLKFFA